MRKFLKISLLSSLFILLISILILTTIGIETNKFNNFISKRINQTNNNLDVQLSTIKFKLDIQEISLFLETKSPQINYKNVTLPAKIIKVYVDFISIFKSEPKIEKVYLASEELDIKKLKKISTIFKPSNLKSFVNNKIKSGKLNAELEIYLNKENLLDDFIAKGSVVNLSSENFKNIGLEKTNFTFFADKTDILIKNFFTEIGPLKIKEGDIKINLSPTIDVESNFKSNLSYDVNSDNYKKTLEKINFIQYVFNFDSNLNNFFKLKLDKTYKVKNYEYKNNGIIRNASLDIKKIIKNDQFLKTTEKIYIVNSDIKTLISSSKKNFVLSGMYKLDKGDLLEFNLNNTFKKDSAEIDINLDYDKSLNLDLINYKKTKGKIASFSLNLDKRKDNLIIKKINYSEKNTSIQGSDIKLRDNKLLSFNKVIVRTEVDGVKNNDFSLSFGKKVMIKGRSFDASNLSKFFKQKNDINRLELISKDFEIDFTNIIVPLSEKIKNFKLIGKIKNGKFTKISSKGDFGNNNFLDISLKSDNLNKKKYLEIYSDKPQPLLAEFGFFKGLTGGKMLFSSIIESNYSNSKLKIEDFKVINAPGMVKLLALADLGGLADLAEGEGLSFDILEINMKRTNDTLQLNEIIALGPSISVLMEGYQTPSITSLKGNLVPAKTLNTIISKIPVLGDIIIPKEVGEGLFGISFKMKGPPGNVKTTINPIRTVTPRFIQKIIDKRKTK